MDALFTKLSTIENFEEVLAEIVNTAARRFEMKCYMTPKEKHMLLKVCTMGYFTMTYVLQSRKRLSRSNWHILTTFSW